MNENELSHAFIGAAIEVHKELGPGLLEDVYEEALSFELHERGYDVKRQIEIPVIYKGNRLQKIYRLDLLIADLVIVEFKSTLDNHPVYRAQCLTHLRLTGKKPGLVINFGEAYLKNGVHRVVNGLQE